jgi:hypothetical protein
MQILRTLKQNDGGRGIRFLERDREVCLLILVKMFSYYVSTINFILSISFVDHECDVSINDEHVLYFDFKENDLVMVLFSNITISIDPIWFVPKKKKRSNLVLWFVPLDLFSIFSICFVLLKYTITQIQQLN